MEKELEVAKKVAREAGRVLLEFAQGETQVHWKGHNDPVTAADRAANDLIVRELQRHFPADGILAEETPDNNARLAKDRVWMIDPMDGTKQFIERIGEFSVMIGLAVDGEAAAGVVYHPSVDRLYYAASGLGAYVEEQWTTKRLQVARISDAAQAVMAKSRSHNTRTADLIAAQLGVKQDLRHGSVGLKFALIAEARAHFYVNPGTKTSQWDTCAADVILREAGGRVTDLTGAPLAYNAAEVRNLRGIIATNEVLHEQVLAATAKVLAAFNR